MELKRLLSPANIEVPVSASPPAVRGSSAYQDALLEKSLMEDDIGSKADEEFDEEHKAKKEQEA